MKINHAVMHVFDFVACENTYAQEEMDLGNKVVKNYVTRLARKALTDIDNKCGAFAPDSVFAAEVRDYFRGGQDLVALSTKIGEFLVRELGHMEKSVSTDLLVVDFEENIASPGVVAAGEDECPFDEGVATVLEDVSDRYLALMLLESKQAYVHTTMWGEVGARNEVERHRAVLPNTSQKIPSFAVVNLRTLDVMFQDKKRVISGEETLLIPDGLLQCSVQASTRETLAAVTEIVEEVAQEYGANTAVALSTAKAAARICTEESEDLDLEDLADEVFGDNTEMVRRFHEEVAERQIPERVPVRREAVQKITRNHKIVTDTGIVITFPAEYSKSSEYITFTSDSDGKISIELKNISSFENR